MSSNGNGKPTVHRIWEGACGLAFEPKKKNDGSYFWTFKFTRAFKREGSENFEYAQDFTARNNEALGVLMLKGIKFQEEHDASEWVREKMAKIPEQATQEAA